MTLSLSENNPEKEEDIFFDKIKNALEEQGLSIDRIDEEGLIYVTNGELELRISLDNVRKEYERDKDETYISEFISAITYSLEPIPDWEIAKSNIFLSLFPSDYDYGDFVNYPVTEKFHTVFIYSSDSKNTWVDYDQLKEWNISEKELVATAYRNMDEELSKTSLEITIIEDRKLAYLETEHDTLKSSLLLSKNLKEKVFAELGWGICAVLPVRDFCYLFSEKDFDFFSERLGSVVVDEYKKSGYPITTEIIKISDEGITAFGEYSVE